MHLIEHTSKTNIPIWPFQEKKKKGGSMRKIDWHVKKIKKEKL